MLIGEQQLLLCRLAFNMVAVSSGPNRLKAQGLKLLITICLRSYFSLIGYFAYLPNGAKAGTVTGYLLPSTWV